MAISNAALTLFRSLGSYVVVELIMVDFWLDHFL